MDLSPETSRIKVVLLSTTLSLFVPRFYIIINIMKTRLLSNMRMSTILEDLTFIKKKESYCELRSSSRSFAIRYTGL